MERRYRTQEELDHLAAKLQAEFDEKAENNRMNRQAADVRAALRLQNDQERQRKAHERYQAKKARLQEEGMLVVQQAANEDLERKRTDLLRAWRLSGGSVEEFDAQWPQLRMEMITTAAEARSDEVRRNQIAAGMKLI
jgi:uncharacterized protein (DUF433 family)